MEVSWEQDVVCWVLSMMMVAFAFASPLPLRSGSRGGAYPRAWLPGVESSQRVFALAFAEAFGAMGRPRASARRSKASPGSDRGRADPRATLILGSS